MFLGFAGQGYKLHEDNLRLSPGSTATVGRFTVRHDSITVTSDEQKQMITGHVTVFRGGKEIAQMTPARWFFAKHEDQPTTEVAIRRGPGRGRLHRARRLRSRNAERAPTRSRSIRS